MHGQSTRLLITALLLGAAMLLSTATTPGMTFGVATRTLAFVAALPWLFALLIVPPSRVARAAAALGRPGKHGDLESGTDRVLDVVSELTVAAGAMTTVASWASFLAHPSPPDDGFTGRVGGVILAALAGPAFAAVLWLLLYAPTARAIRRRSPERDGSERAKGGREQTAFGWRLVATVVVTVIVVEVARSAIMLRPPIAHEPIPDASFTIAPAAAPPTEAQPAPRRIELLDAVVARVGKKTIRAAQGSGDEIAPLIERPRRDGPPHAFEITTAPGTTTAQVIGALAPRGPRVDPRDHTGDRQSPGPRPPRPPPSRQWRRTPPTPVVTNQSTEPRPRRRLHRDRGHT